jgi:hypothetical protein
MSRSQVIKTLAEITSLLDQEDLSMVGGGKPKIIKGGCSACGGCGSCGGGFYGASSNFNKPPRSSHRTRSVPAKKSKSVGASKNPWILFLKHLEHQTGRSYAELISDPNVSAAYRSQFPQ